MSHEMDIELGHCIHESVVREGSGAETVRYRAFCRCGWVSTPTWVKATHDAAVAAHVASLAGDR